MLTVCKYAQAPPPPQRQFILETTSLLTPLIQNSNTCVCRRQQRDLPKSHETGFLFTYKRLEEGQTNELLSLPKQPYNCLPSLVINMQVGHFVEFPKGQELSASGKISLLLNPTWPSSLRTAHPKPRCTRALGEVYRPQLTAS